MFIAGIFSPQFILFLLFGGAAALVNLVMGKLLYDLALPGMSYSLSVFIAAFSGLLVNFFCNYYFNFTNHMRRPFSHFRSFFIVAVIGTFLTSFLSRLFLGLFTLCGLEGLQRFGPLMTNRFMAHFLAVGLVVFYSYFAHKYISFDIGFRGQAKKLFEWHTSRKE